MELTRATPPATIKAPIAAGPFIEAAPVAYAMGLPVEVAAVATPVEAMVPVEDATPAVATVEDGQA